MMMTAQAFVPDSLMQALEFQMRSGRGFNEENLRALTTYMLGYNAIFICAGILIGGYVSYFIAKRYCDLKAAIENKYADENERVSVMAQHGGFHQWVVKLIIAVVVFINIVLLLALFAAIAAR
jgi:hypothetical protein